MRDIGKLSESDATAGSSAATSANLVTSVVTATAWAVTAFVHFGVGVIVGLARPASCIALGER
ncbi:hypothetical protein HFP15_37900 [Amycolatopsis sp. K13G38]|uniref:Uncharacterized protein n=1 Tax=Amycolatopsis acididurans TaxID=2724524 RepID=A0ABX1JFR7_9PSEU|nr:hypothetical protein [Amycolatopsis acididurans]NKQ58633.1 hypothetical protein [Amycolatopsis acididurans]